MCKCDKRKSFKVYNDSGEGFRCFMCGAVVWEKENKSEFEAIYNEKKSNLLDDTIEMLANIKKEADNK